MSRGTGGGSIYSPNIGGVVVGTIAQQINAALARGERVVLPEGVFQLEEPLLFPSGSSLIGQGWHRTKLLPTVNPSSSLADDPTNYLMAAASTIAGSDATTLAARAYPDSYQISTNASLAVGQWIILRAGNSIDDWAAAGANVVREDVARVVAISGSGPYTVTLDRKTAPYLGSGASVRLVTAVVNGVHIEGVDLQLEGLNYAVGVLLEGVVDSYIDIAGAGASRGLVHLRRGARDNEVRVHHRGQSNAVVFLQSAHFNDCTYSWNESRELGRKHALGIPRGLITEWHRCRDNRHSGDLGNGCTGAVVKGSVGSLFENLRVRETLLTGRAGIDTTMLPMTGGVSGGAAGIEFQGTPGSAESEYSFGCEARNCVLEDTRVPHADGYQSSLWACDAVDLVVDGCAFVNNGRDANASGEALMGCVFYDTLNVHLDNLSFRGVEAPFAFLGNVNTIHIGSAYVDQRNAFTAITKIIRCGHLLATGSDIRFDHLVLEEATGFLTVDIDGYTVDHASMASIKIQKLTAQNIQRTWDNVRVAIDVSGTGPQIRGAVMQLRLAQTFTADNTTEILTCTAHGWPDGTAVYVRPQAGGGGTLPAGLTAGTIYYVVQSAANTFKLSATVNGSPVNITTNGTPPNEVQSLLPAVIVPTTATNVDKVTEVNGSGFFGSLPLPLQHPLVSFGPARDIAVADATIALSQERLEAVNASTKAVVNNASTTPLGIVEVAKPTGAAGTVQAAKPA